MLTYTQPAWVVLSFLGFYGIIEITKLSRTKICIVILFFNALNKFYTSSFDHHAQERSVVWEYF